MRKNRLVRVGFVTLVWVVVAAVAASRTFADPPPLEIPPGALTAGLGSQTIQQINDRLKYWRDQIAGASTVKSVIGARNGIGSDFRRSDSTEYQYPFARSAAEIMTPLLTGTLSGDDKLLAVKEINTGIALSRMPQVTIVPALEVMVAHKNEAVRFLGVEGYRGVRTGILAQPSSVARRMFRTLGSAAAKEQSAPVIGAMFVTFNVSPFVASVIPEDTVRRAQMQALAILRAHWPRWCRRLLNGDAEMSKAFEKGIATMRTLAGGPTSAPDRKREILQSLIDLSWCAARAYDAAGGKGEIGKASESLLRRCERALNAITQRNRSHLSSPLSDKEVSDRGAAVRFGVLNWIADLKDFGVVKPKFEPPTSQPTTRPATQPSA